MSRKAIPTWSFVLVVVRLGRRFLLVHEKKHGQLWYLPGGRVERGETFVAAAKREAMEESGVPVVVEGIMRVEHSARTDDARMRVIFVARPADDTPPKESPDEDTLKAGWFTLAELRELPLRGEEVCDIFSAVENGAPIYPLSLLTIEGAPY